MARRKLSKKPADAEQGKSPEFSESYGSLSWRQESSTGPVLQLLSYVHNLISQFLNIHSCVSL